MNGKIILAAAMLAAVVAPAAQAATVVATFTGGIGGMVTRNIVSGAGAPQLNAPQNVEQFYMDRTGGTSATNLVGAGAVDFFAWCIEPREFITMGQSISYTLVPLSQAASNIGGIGAFKANQVRELFGRFNNNFANPLTAQQAGAFQIALWEIVRETPGNALDLFSGNISFDAGSDNVAGTLALASSYVSAIDGTGPKAQRLVVLSNGIFGVQGSGTQDLIVQGNVPEPSAWAMLILGFGFVGVASRRRQISIAA